MVRYLISSFLNILIHIQNTIFLTIINRFQVVKHLGNIAVTDSDGDFIYEDVFRRYGFVSALFLMILNQKDF